MIPSFFLSKFLIPARLNKFVSKLPLIAISKGESVAKEGDRLTSSNHGFKLLSIITSNPNNSKQLFLCVDDLLRLSTTLGSIEMRDFIMISYIRLQSNWVSTPTVCKCLNKADKDHLFPISSDKGLSF